MTTHCMAVDEASQAFPLPGTIFSNEIVFRSVSVASEISGSGFLNVGSLPCKAASVRALS